MSIAEINTPNGIDLYCASLNVANSISCATIYFSSVQYDAAAYSTFAISAATVNTLAGVFGSFSSFAYSTATLGTINGVSTMAISSGTANYIRTTIIDASVCRLSTVTTSKAVVQDFAAKVGRFSVITASTISISVPTVSISTFTNVYASNAYMDNAGVSSLGASVAAVGALTATSAFLANATTSSCVVSVAGIGALDASSVSAGSVAAADVLLGGGSLSSSLSSLQSQITTLQTAVSGLGGSSSVSVYNASTAYTSTARCLYNGMVFQAASTMTSITPLDYIFYDDFSSYCDSTQLSYATPPYSQTNIMNATGFTTASQVYTDGSGAAYLSGPGNAWVTLDFTGKSATWVLDLACKTYSAPGVDLYWGLPTVSNGTLVATYGNNSANFAIQSGQLSGGASCSVSVSGGGTWAMPVSGDKLRFTKVSTTQATIQIYHAGSWGNTATFTLSGATLANTFYGLGINGQAFTSYAAVASTAEYSKPWSLAPQPANRVVLTTGSPSGSLDATQGRIFVTTGSIAANSVSAMFSLSSKYVVPGSRVMATICTNGTPTLQGVGVCIREIGWGLFRFYIYNGTASAISCNLTLIFNVSWPLSLTP